MTPSVSKGSSNKPSLFQSYHLLQIRMAKKLQWSWINALLECQKQPYTSWWATTLRGKNSGTQEATSRNFTEDTYWSPGHCVMPSQSNFFCLVARNIKRDNFYPKMSRMCEATYVAPNPKETLLTTPLPKHPWKRVAVDLFQLNG